MKNCLGTHRAGDGSFLLYDMNNIPCERVCKICEPLVKARPSVSGRLESRYEQEESLRAAYAYAERFNFWRMA